MYDCLIIYDRSEYINPENCTIFVYYFSTGDPTIHLSNNMFEDSTLSYRLRTLCMGWSEYVNSYSYACFYKYFLDEDWEITEYCLFVQEVDNRVLRESELVKYIMEEADIPNVKLVHDFVKNFSRIRKERTSKNALF